MGMAVGGESDFNSEINVTPMVDIMLVLLIIFMVVTPLLQKDVTVALPRDMNNPDEDQAIIKDDSVVISMPDNDRVFIGKEEYPKNQLGDKIGKMMELNKSEKRIVYLKSGVDVDYGKVVEVLNIIRKQDIDQIGLVADKKKGGGAPS